MKTLFRTGLAVVTFVLAGLTTSATLAATVVDVSLWDKGAATAMGTGMMFGMPGMKDMPMATMGIKTSSPSVRAGVVTFHVTNDSKDTVHEMIVMYLADPSQPLPFITAENRVDEDKAGDKGEVSELDPGATGALTVVLQPGKYLLICNVPGHYAAGMWSEFEVTK